jgi:uncharacterized membrane protein
VTVVSVLTALGFLLVIASLGDVLNEAIPHLREGTVPNDAYIRNYVLHPWPAALHVAPGLIYLFIAPLQLSSRFRRKHLTLHRRLGRALVLCGLLAGIFALVVGLTHPFDGVVEASATAVFGAWFLAALVIAFVAVRRRDIATHRRWMIRAFAAGIGIASIRLWVGIFGGVQKAVTGTEGTPPLQGSYGLAFWMGFASTVLVGEWWLRRK